jgi:hypothetical protein
LERRYDQGSHPLFPLYSSFRRLLDIIAGVPKGTVTSMIRDIFDQTGTPQHTVDWTHPDTWIVERLSGAGRELARRIWQESDRTVNRHIYGEYQYS